MKLFIFALPCAFLTHAVLAKEPTDAQDRTINVGDTFVGRMVASDGNTLLYIGPGSSRNTYPGLVAGETSVRLFGIDAPEQDEDFGREARAKLDEVLGRQPINCDVVDVELRSHRLLPIAVCTSGGQDLAAALLSHGLATVERAILYQNVSRIKLAERYDAAEKKAREVEAGLWGGNLSHWAPKVYRERWWFAGISALVALVAVLGAHLLAEWRARSAERRKEETERRKVVLRLAPTLLALWANIDRTVKSMDSSIKKRPSLFVKSQKDLDLMRAGVETRARLLGELSAAWPDVGVLRADQLSKLAAAKETIESIQAKATSISITEFVDLRTMKTASQKLLETLEVLGIKLSAEQM